jgi:2-dehydro-3-deoxyglucarate aldolase/4-hydroxy-2-oxoheptanedioate aldolase
MGERIALKENRCKQIIAEGKVPIGHMILEFGSRGQAQILEQAGLDFVIIDQEHSSFTVAQVADIIAWFKATAIAPFVRIPEIHYHLISRLMDAGALGIMVPNVKTSAQASAVVAAAKYAPLGHRGVIMGSAHSDFMTVNPPEYMAYANDNTTLICQIESQEGLENIEAIASTPGVDMLWLGHYDLTQSLGIPGQFDHQDFLDGINKVIDAAQRHKLRAGIQPGSLSQVKEWLSAGFDVISYSADFSVYQTAMRQSVTEIRGYL